MTTAVLVTARLGSTRLARKHLRPVAGQPILRFLLTAIEREFQAEIREGRVLVAIASSLEPENREFLSALPGSSVFFGSEHNIPLRHLQAAEHFRAQNILSVDGDDILCAPAAMRAVFEALERGAAYARTEGLPLGLNATGYSAAAIREALGRFAPEEVLETGWGRLFEQTEQTVLELPCEPAPELRFTLDYPEDLRFFQALLDLPDVAGGRVDAGELVRRVRAAGLDRITEPVVREYWRNFQAAKAQEAQGGHREL